MDGEIRIPILATFKVGMPVKHPSGNARKSKGSIDSGACGQSGLKRKYGNPWHSDVCDAVGLDKIPPRHCRQRRGEKRGLGTLHSLVAKQQSPEEHQKRMEMLLGGHGDRWL